LSCGYFVAAVGERAPCELRVGLEMPCYISRSEAKGPFWMRNVIMSSGLAVVHSSATMKLPAPSAWRRHGEIDIYVGASSRNLRGKEIGSPSGRLDSLAELEGLPLSRLHRAWLWLGLALVGHKSSPPGPLTLVATRDDGGALVTNPKSRSQRPLQKSELAKRDADAPDSTRLDSTLQHTPATTHL
jgi:hypothetical protein